MAKIYQSVVPDSSGLCKSTWINTSRIDNRLDGGRTGFFKLVRPHWLLRWKKYGPEFHGILKNGTVHPTQWHEEVRDKEYLYDECL